MTRLLVIIAWLPCAVAIDAWTLATLWRWYIVTEFHAKPLTMFGACGLSLLASYATSHLFSREESKKDESVAVMITRRLMIVGLLLLIGLVGRAMFAPGA